MAGHGATVHPVRAERRYPGHVRLPHARGAHVRDDQFRGGFALRRCRSAYSHPREQSLKQDAVSKPGAQPEKRPFLDRWVRLRDSDILHSFLKSKLVVFAAFIALGLVTCALLAPLIAPHNPFDLVSLS